MVERPAAQQNRPLRPLLSAAKKHDDARVPTRPSRMAKPTHTAAACDSCRKHKTKCSGDRPTRRRCAERTIPCHYTARRGEVELQSLRRENRDLRERASEHEEVVALLRRLSEHDAQGVLRRLRAGAAVAAILGQARAVDALLQMVVVPETRFQ